MSDYDTASAEAIASLNQGGSSDSGASDIRDSAPLEGQQTPEEARGDASAQPQAQPAPSGNPAPAPSATPAQGQAPQQVWDGSQWKLKYRDKEIVPKDREHLVNLAQQGYAFNHKMQELKQREEEIEKVRQQYAPYQQLNEAFDKNPAFREKIMALYRETATGGQAPQSQDGQQPQPSAALPPEVLKDLQEIREWKSQQEQERQQEQEARADQEVVREMESLQSEFKRDDWDTLSSTGSTLKQEVIRHALEMGGVPLKMAYKDLMWDSHMKNVEAEALNRAAQAKAEAAKAGIVAGGKSRGAPSAPGLNPTGMSYDALEKQIIQDFQLHSQQ